MITRNHLSNHYLCLINLQNVLDWELILTRPKQYGLAQGRVAMNSSFQINIYHGTFLENLSYWVLVLICLNLIKHWKILQKKFYQTLQIQFWMILKKYFIHFYAMVKRTRSRDPLLSSFPPAISTCWLHKQNSYQSSCELSWTYQQWAGVITKFSQHLNDNSCEDDKSK